MAKVNCHCFHLNFHLHDKNQQCFHLLISLCLFHKIVGLTLAVVVILSTPGYIDVLQVPFLVSHLLQLLGGCDI